MDNTRKHPTFEQELELKHSGYTKVIGVDEVGRGCVFGSVVAAAVCVPESMYDYLYGKVDDSKKLSEKKRIELARDIVGNCDVGVGSIDNTIIDDINILEATKLAMKAALYDLGCYDFVLVDGTVVLDSLDAPQRQIIKGDSTSASIAAASIVAKVVRDNMMYEFESNNALFSLYGIAKNKGYLTKQHRNAIMSYGPTKYHRLSFKGVKEYV